MDLPLPDATFHQQADAECCSSFTTPMAAANPSSQFAAILRRSKFASFDPTIGQVYTSYGGHLHRGNWGIKRPLPIRRRDAYITVNAVDSREEQTEWKAGDTEGRFAKMWDEVTFTPRLDNEGPWATKLGERAEVDWKLDTEFVDSAEAREESRAQLEAEGSIYGPTSSAVPNIHAMSDKEFKRYIEKLRQSRHAFASYFKEVSIRKSQQTGSQYSPEFSSLWDSSWETSKTDQSHKKFLASQAHHAYNSPESRSIEQQPQTFAGLTYGKSSMLQDLILSKPKPGRVVSSNNVSFAGVRANGDFSSAVVSTQVDFSKLAKNGERDPEEGFGMFRLKSVTFSHGPQTVGKKPQGLASSQLRVIVVPDGAGDMQRSNTQWPGSPGYVGHNAKKVRTDTMLSKAKPNVPSKAPEDKSSSKQVLSTLQGILVNSTREKNQDR